jgi:branched-chain amino acid aminotransferase
MSAAVDPRFIWRNGEIVPWADATVHVNAVGHASVSSVFEGIRAYVDAAGALQIFRVEEHMRRLHESLRIVRLPCPYRVDQLVAATIDLLRANDTRVDTYIRPWVFIKGIVREAISRTLRETETVIDTWPLESTLLTHPGCRAGVSSWARIDDASMPPRVKAFSNYHNSRLANLEAGAHGFDTPIFLNERGKVAEGAGACIALVRRGRLITPTLTSGVLDSITRDTILRLAREVVELAVEEREVDRSELYLADEVFFVGTGWEIMPVLDIDGITIGDGRRGALTNALARAYHDVARGIDARHPEWRTAMDVSAAHARGMATR